MNFKTLPGSVLAWLRGSRCKCLLVMTLLGLVLRENYPFSNFPMFSSFSHKTYFVHLTDAQGVALGIRQFGLSNSGMKKIFDGYRRKDLKRFVNAGKQRVPLAEAAAAQSLLHYLNGLTKARPATQKLLRGLQIQYVKVQQENDALRLETKSLAQHQ
ncbi:MAG TPA: hypothetical protein VGF73_05390 [Chthoniobacterales bacterium]|jgi:hypothetical protein